MPKKKKTATKVVRAAPKQPRSTTLVYDDVLGSIVDDINKFFKASKEAPAVKRASEGGFDGNISGFITSGIDLIDMLFRGGVPRGRITEIFGRPQGGKSTFAGHVVASVQKMGGTAFLNEAEHTWDDDRAEVLKVDLSRIVVSVADTIEHGFAFFEEILRSLEREYKERLRDIPILLLWDSLDESMIGDEATAEDFEERYGGIQSFAKARVIRSGLRRLVPWIARNQATVLLLNQIMSQMFGEDSPGGWGLKHNATIRARFTPKGPITTGGEKAKVKVGMHTKLRVDKIKVSGPRARFMEVPLQIYDDRGFDNDLSNFAFLKEFAAGDPDVQVKGAWVNLKCNGKTHGLQLGTVRETLDETPELREHMRAVVRRNFLHDEFVRSEPRGVEGVEDDDDE